MKTYKPSGFFQPEIPTTLNSHGLRMAALLKDDARTKVPLESLPDLIQGLVTELGIDLNNLVPSVDQPTTAFNFIPPDLEKAFKDGDHQAVDRITQAGAKDMDPIYANMQQHEDQAWVQIMNQSNQTPYWISIGGDPKNPSGYMWTYTDPKPVGILSAKSDPDPGYVHTVQVGTLSRNTKFLGISNQLWDNKALAATVAGISTIVTAVLTRYISRRIAGTAFAEALTQASLKAGQSLISRGVVTEASWIAGGAFAAKFVGGAVAGAALTLLLMFIAEFVYREYKCCINVYNWTDKPLIVGAYWGDNERIDDDQPFVRAALPSASTSIVLPDGMSAPTTGSQVVSYATYVFANKNKFLEGLGVAMSVEAGADNDGVLLGYYLGRFADNMMALSGDTSQSLSDFYKKSDSWAPKGSYKYNIELPDGTPVICSTPSLSGREDQFYEFSVCIGLKPSQKFLDDPSKDPQPTKPRDYPTQPDFLTIGDKITLPGGEEATVVGKMHPTYIV